MRFSAYLTAAAFAALAIAARADGPAKDQRPATNKEKNIEQLLIAAQEICPVTGQKLGSMGKPIKAKSGKRTVYLCCKGCMGKPIKPQAWKQIQNNWIEAQGICPTSKKPLSEDPPASVVVEGRTIYVCCKGCAGGVEADPAAALTLVNQQIMKHVKAEKAKAK